MYRIIKASEEDTQERFDPYYGKKYRIDGGHDVKFTDNPVEAIKYWFQLEEKYHHDAAIMTKTRNDAVEIAKAATEELIWALWSKYNCGYKAEYLIEFAAKHAEDGQRYFNENMYGDQVDPFSYG